jgi:hypothetical protein
MKPSLSTLVLPALLLSLYGVTCEAEDTELTDDPTLDLWCGEQLCDSWDSEGKVRRVGTWHEGDFAVELGSRGATLSQHIERGDEYSCVELHLHGKWSSESQLFVEIDWSDDGTVDWSAQVPASDWKNWSDTIGHSPNYHSSLRIIVRRAGTEPAILSEVRVTKVWECTRSTLDGCNDNVSGSDDDAGCD